MKLRLIIPAALTAVALAGCGSTASDSAGADASASDSAAPTASESTDAGEPSPDTSTEADPPATPEETADADANGPLPTTAQDEVPAGAGVASFSDCSDEYLALTQDLMPGGAVTPELLEKWQNAYQDSSQYYAEGSPAEAAAACSGVLADVKATLGR